MMRQHRDKLLASLMFTLLSTFAVFAGDGTWTTHGPYGARITWFTFHPARANEMFLVSAAGSPYGFFKTTNTGKTWQRIDTPDKFDSVTIHPAAPSTIIAVSLHSFANPILLYVYRSTDDGEHWSNVSKTEILPHYFYSSIRDLKVSPGSPDVLYLYIYTAGLFKSTDGGITWARKMHGLPANEGDAKIGIDQINSSLLYVVFGNGNVYKSDDAAESWRLSSNGIKNSTHAYAPSIALSAGVPNVVYASAQFLAKSTNAGKNWTTLRAPLLFGVQRLFVDPRNSNRIILATDSGGLISSDGGKNWATLKFPSSTLIEARVIGSPPLNSKVLFIGSTYDLAKSTDNGKTWRRSEHGINGETVTRLEGSAKPRVVILAKTGNPLQKIYKYRGSNWRRLLVDKFSFLGDKTDFVISQVKVHPLDSNYLVCASEDAIAISTNGGRSWRFIDALQSIYDLALHPKNKSIIYLNSGRTLDGGKNWQIFNLPNQGFATIIRVYAKNGSLVYAVGGNTLYKSTNSGSSWAQLGLIGPPIGISDLELHPNNPNILYAAGINGVYKSIDGGRTWILRSQGLPTYYMSFVYVNPNHPQNLFAGGGTHDLFVSNDGAATWQAFDTSQLQGFGINNVLIDPSNPNRLFVATEGGVFSHLLD